MSLLAKKVGLLEEYRGKVAALEKEIAEMLNLTVPKRSYQKRTPELSAADNDDEPEAPTGEYTRVRRRLQGQRTSPEEVAEIERLAKGGKHTGPDIVRATGRSLATINRVLHDAGLKLSELRGRGPNKSRRVLATRQTAIDPATVLEPNAREKKVIELRAGKKSQKEIATALRTDVKTVRAILKKHGLNESARKITDAQRSIVLRMQAEGKYTVPEITAKAGLGASAYYRIINNAKKSTTK